MTCIASMADEYDPASPTLEIDGNNGVKQIQLDKENFVKPEKVKSRWRRNSEMETEESEMSEKSTLNCISENKDLNAKLENLPTFELLEENLYLFERKRTKGIKENRRMLCECTVKPNEVACGEDCLNRLLMIECGPRCVTGEVCSNRRFEKKLYAKTEPFKTEKKGFGLRVLEDVPKNGFIMEYCGEVLNRSQFKKRVKQYAREKEEHYYFMALKIDQIIDARNQANFARFINHSCDPNCETQKWTVFGDIRIGFFAKRDIKAYEELTFDYMLERYGRAAQKCHCGSQNCKGFIGVSDEITVDIETKKSNKRKKSAEKEKEKEERKRDVFEDLNMLEEEIEKLSINSGLRNKDDTLMLARLMVRAEDTHSREKLLDILLGTTETACLRLFLDSYHGLTLFWSWMADLKDLTGHKLKKKILKVLSLLPVPNRTMLIDSKILDVVEKWASYSFGDESTKNKSCDTSDSETERTFSEGDHLTFTNSDSDRTFFSNCDVNMPKNINSIEKSSENTEESSSDNKASDTNIRSDEESGDTLEDDNLDDNNKERNSEATAEITNLARNLLDSWKDLKEIFRIPKRESRINQNRESKTSEVITKEGSTDEKSHSFGMEGKPNKIKVVYRTYNEDMRSAMSNEKHISYSNKTRSYERRKIKNTARYQYDNSSDYSHRNNYEYPPPYSSHTEGDNSHHYVPVENEYMYTNGTHCSNFAPRPPLLPTPGTSPNMGTSPNVPICAPLLLPTPGTSPNMGTSPNVICAPLLPTSATSPNMGTPTNVIYVGPPQSAITTAPPVLPNVMFPPPAKPYQMPLLNLPPPTVPSLVSEHSAAIVSCPPNNNVLPPSHLIGVAVSSPLMPMQINTSSLSTEHVDYLNTENKYYEYTDPSFSFSTAENTEQAYLSAHENGEVPKTTAIKLPPNWKTAFDNEGNMYYYHMKTRQTQWLPPGIEENMDVDNTPTYDEKPKGETPHKHESHSRRHKKKSHSKRKTTTAAADTSSRDVVNEEIAKKLFRSEMSTYVVTCLNPYRRDDCKTGRITSTEDFKHLARKLTHFVMAKELKHCKNIEDLDANDSVKLKARDYIRKYMDRYGPVYRKEKFISVGAD